MDFIVLLRGKSSLNGGMSDSKKVAPAVSLSCWEVGDGVLLTVYAKVCTNLWILGVQLR